MRLRETPKVLLAGAVALLATAAVGAGSASAATSPAHHHFGASAPSAAITKPGTSITSARVGALAVLPTHVDLRKWAVTPGNQGETNSCVAWAIGYALLGWYSNFTGQVGAPFAPMYTYSQINGGGDYGANPTAALDIALNQGSDTAAHYAKGTANWKHVPTAAERANAARYKITGYDVLFTGANQASNSTTLKTAIAALRPVAVKVAVRNGFEYIGTSSTAVDNDTTTAINGYHEVLAVGYDAAGLIVQNSWGTGWANGGFGRISWKVVQQDVWEGETIHGLVPGPTAPTVRVAIARHSGPKVSSTRTPMTITWNGKAGTSGAITRYGAWVEVDGKARVGVPLSSATASAVRINALIGHRYRISVRAQTATATGYLTYGAWFTA